jgi:hypothetical protein
MSKKKQLKKANKKYAALEKAYYEQSYNMLQLELENERFNKLLKQTAVLN